jgi:hypothetical protein
VAYSETIRREAERLYLLGIEPADIASTLGIKTQKTVYDWAAADGWKSKRDAARKLDSRSPLQVQEDLIRVAGQTVTRLCAAEDPDVTVLARWQDILAKAQAIKDSIFAQATDPEIFVRFVEMLTRHVATLPEERRCALGDAVSELLTDFQTAVKTGKVKP